MKVYIGPYKKHLSFSKLGDFLESLNVPEYYADKVWYFFQFFANKLWNDLGKQGQTTIIKIDNYDIWGLDTTLSQIIAPAIKLLKENKQGAPVVDYEDVPEELRPTEEDKKKLQDDPGWTDDKFFERWDWVMNEMLYAFETYNTDWEDKFHSGTIDIKFEKTENSSFSKMVRGPKDTHKFDIDGYKAELNRIQNGMRLFGKYYMSLWD